MTQRERYLAIGVAVVVGLLIAQYAFKTVTSTLQEKEDAVNTAMAESSRMDKIVTNGKLAARKLDELTKKSLPNDQETLVAQYRDWLTQLGHQVEMDEIHVGVPDRAARSTDAYSAYNFSLRGLCRTDRVLDLMGKFYDKDYLHSMRGFKMNLTRDANIIDVTLDSQVLALSSASPEQEPSNNPSGRLAISMDEYKDAILNRNPFSPPNGAPRITTDRRHQIYRGESWSLDVETSDPESHFVSVEVDYDDLPEGMRFRRGSFNWRPQENGEYEVLVRAYDNGWPSQETERTLTFEVVDKPAEAPKPPEFDAASQTFVSAIVSGRGGPEAWIRSRTDGETLYLKEGQDFEIGSIKAKIVRINLREDFVELESEDLRWTIGMDTSLADAFAKSQVD